jgi:RNA polymerase sigma factor (sigma-70 family)
MQHGLMPPKDNRKTSWYKKAGFTATRWSIVLAAAIDQSGISGRRALEELIQIYWFPLYAYIRRQGHGVQEAEDLVQEFFTRLLEKKYLAHVDRSKGKFRSFLLASLKHFLANEWDKSHTQKRGGQSRLIALDALKAEARYALEPVDTLTPDRLFERRWALAVLDHVLGRLRQEYLAHGKDDLFEGLKDSLIRGTEAIKYADIARELGMTEGAVKVAVHRMRQRYRDLLRDEIAQTVDSPAHVEEEIAYLLNCL